MKYSQHPLSSAYPAMPAADFADLVSDIRAHGQHDVATIYEGMVLDGWHRYRACEEIGIPCRVEEFAGSDPAAFVIAKNGRRRHLTESQRAAAIVSVRQWRPADSTGGASHRCTGDTCHPSATVAQMAVEANVNERTIQRAKRAHEAGLGEAVRDGRISANKAAEIAKADPELAKKVAHGEVSLPSAVEKIAPKPKRKAEPEPAPHDELEDAVSALTEENTRLTEEIDTLRRAADPDAVTKISQLKAYIKTVESQRDDWMNQCAMLKREVKRLHRQLGAVAHA